MDNITFNVLSPGPVARPGHNDFYNTPELAEFVKAEKIRVRLEGHYYSHHPRHGYYGICEYIVTGRYLRFIKFVFMGKFFYEVQCTIHTD